MGIAPNIWGPPAWAFLHLMVMSEKEPLDTARLTYYKQLYDLLTHLLALHSLACSALQHTHYVEGGPEGDDE